MPALQIADLNNAKTDVDHIADIANSEELTATDRLGRTKATMAGLAAQYPNAGPAAAAAAASATTATAQATIAATQAGIATAQAVVSTAAALEAEAASRVAGIAAASASGVYPSTADGVAATNDGESFWVYTTAANGLRLYRNVDDTDAEHLFTLDVTDPDDVGAAALFDDEEAGIALDFTTATGVEVKVVDPDTPANDFLGWAKDWFSDASFPYPRRVTLEDGTQGWCDQNLVLQSEDFTNASWGKNNATAVANTLTASSTDPNLNQSISGVGLVNGAHVTAEFIAEAGTSSWAAIAFASGSGRAWFDLTNGVVGSAGVDIVDHAIFTTDFNGAPLPTGRYRIQAKHKLADSLSLRLHWVDADGGTTVTTGRTIKAYGCHVYRGLKAVGYLQTTTAKRFLPFTWETGERTLAVNAAVNLVATSLWGSDLTNAVWTKTNCSAALDATDDKGEPCSTLTATANGGTCTQAVVVATTSHTASLFIKRKTGAGTVEMTINGTDWTDITSQVSASAWARPYIHGTGANPTIGLRLGTSGDEVLVSEFHQADRESLADSIPTFGSAVTATPDAPYEAFTRFSTGTINEFTAYWDLESSGDSAASNGYGGVTAGSDILSMPISGFGASVSLVTTVSAASLTAIAADNVVGGRIEQTMRVKATEVLGSVNGLGAVLLRPAVAPVMNTLRVAGGAQQVFVRRVVVVPRAVDEDDFESWRYSGAATNARYLADKRVASYSDVASSINVREPAIGILWDRPESAGGIVAYGEQNVTTNGEAPNRMRFRKFVFDKTTHTLTMEDPYTVVEPADWASGLGHIQSFTIYKQKYGANKGRVHLLYTQNDSADGLYSTANDHRRVYYRYSDENGDDGTFSAASVVLDRGVGSFALLSPAGDAVEFPADSDYPGRVVVPFYSDTAPVTGILYLDPGGLWTEVAIASGDSDNEPTIFLRPNGELIITVRSSSASTKRKYSKSANGGATWTAWADLAGTYDTISMSTAQSDSEGDFGPQGKAFLVGTSNADGAELRRNLTVEALLGDPPAPSGTQFHPYGTYRFAGYTSARYLADGYLLVATEAPPTTTANARNSIRLMALRTTGL